MSNNKDLYQILNVTEEEKKLPFSEFKTIIKKNYKKLAIQYHPDKQIGKIEEEIKQAEDMFKEVSNAYDILSDENKKRQYDFGGVNANFQSSHFDINDFMKQHMEMNDVFSSFMGGGRSQGKTQFFHMNFGDMYSTQPIINKGQTLQVKIPLTLEELYTGVDKKIKINTPKKCPDCGGSCLAPDGERTICSECMGNGYITESIGFMTSRRVCMTCNGTGEVITHPCLTCHGMGLINGERIVDVNIVQGLYNNSKIVMAGLGGESKEFDGQSGDLILIIEELPHNKFHRQGNDLILEHDIPVIDMILGCEIEIAPLVGNPLKVKIPQGTKDKTPFRLRTKGMSIPQTNFFGDLHLVVNQKYPTKLSDSDKKLLEKLKKSDNFK